LKTEKEINFRKKERKKEYRQAPRVKTLIAFLVCDIVGFFEKLLPSKPLVTMVFEPHAKQLFFVSENRKWKIFVKKNFSTFFLFQKKNLCTRVVHTF
jgi:hypothetical protein